jgi:hypothetical protein
MPGPCHSPTAVFPLACKSGKGHDPFPLDFGGNGESSVSGTSVGVDTISGNLVMRVLRDSLASDPRSSVRLGSGWRSASTLWTDAEWTSDSRQCWNDARCRDALHRASREYIVAGRNIEYATAILSRPGAAGTVQRRRSGDALRGQPHYCDLSTSSRQDEGDSHPAEDSPRRYLRFPL